MIQYLAMTSTQSYFVSISAYTVRSTLVMQLPTRDLFLSKQKHWPNTKVKQNEQMSQCVRYNVRVDPYHFRNESYQSSICSGTDNQPRTSNGMYVAKHKQNQPGPS